MTHDIVAQLSAQQKLLAAHTPYVLVTLVAIRGSAPQVVGAKAIVTAAGLHRGTVGGGKIEAAAIKHAQGMLDYSPKGESSTQADGRPPGDAPNRVKTDLVSWNLQTEIGMTCGGEVTLLFELITVGSWPIVVYGAGHVAQHLIPILLTLDCSVTCVDSRSEWLEQLPESPRLRRLCVEQPATTVAEQPAGAFFVLMSKGHATDLPVLAEILKSRLPPFVGVIGSKQKASVLRRDLKAAGLPQESIERFVCPIGLPLGRNTPAEISISIIAQLLQVRDAAGCQ